MGVATFAIDSFSGRGVVNTDNDESQLGRLMQTEDAYRAFELLSKHPRIDADRIMLMGFLRGAQATLVATLKRVQRAYAASHGSEFAAYLALYPNCSWTYRDDTDVADKPIHVFQGSADDYVAACRAYVARVRASGERYPIYRIPRRSPCVRLAGAEATHAASESTVHPELPARGNGRRADHQCENETTVFVQ